MDEHQPGTEPGRQNTSEQEIGEITRFLREWAAGNKESLNVMMPKAFKKLQETARYQYGRTRGQGADRPTELVSHVWERLAKMEKVPDIPDSKRFYAYCARIIRNLLLDHMGPGQNVESLDALVDLSFLRDRGKVSPEERVIALELLDRLEHEVPKIYEVFECKIILGFRDLETADILGISVATVQSRYVQAKAWLHQEINK
jgi:RNA polymerase sigma factor (TIGR02999 family)